MEQMQMNMPDIYDAALYLRLSRDDMEEGSVCHAVRGDDFKREQHDDFRRR